MRLVLNLLSRALFAVILVGVLFGCGYIGGWLFFAVIGAMTILGLWEYYNALRTKDMRPNAKLGWFCALLILIIAQYSENVRTAIVRDDASALGLADLNVITGSLHLTLLVLLFCVAGTLVGQFSMREGESQVVNAATTVFGVVYIGLLFSFTLHMRYVDVPGLMGHEAGEFARRMGALTFVIAPIWMCDTSAYVAGNLWGKRKLAPKISPGKTIEGSIAGFLGAIVGALICGTWLGMSVMQCITLGAVMGTVGQLGDLGKSVLKRDIGVKDFGHIFGPHGGVLDRFDAILFGMPLVYWYFWFLVMRVSGT